MDINLNGRIIVVRGVGINGAACLYHLEQMGIHIDFFATKNREVDSFREIKVIDIDDIPEDSFVIVATSIENYIDIASELRAKQRREFYDFVYYEWFFKKIVLLHGNCHMIVIKEFLMSSLSFRENYSIYPYPLLVSDTKDFRTEPEIFQNIDVWVHEDIRDNNQFGYYVSDEYIRSNVSDTVLEIVMPHLYGIGHMLFPQSYLDVEGNELLNNGKDKIGMFPYGDSVIEECIRNGNRELAMIIDYVKSDGAISSKEIKENFLMSIKKLEEREKAWHIQIKDYILENYKYKKLFYDEAHPTNIVFEYIAHEILKRLDVDEEEIKSNVMLDSCERFVYPCVKKVLGIEWDEYEIRKSGKKLVNFMDFDEYIQEYCWWRHHDLFF